MFGDEVITEYICQQSYFQRLCQDVLLKYQTQNMLGIEILTKVERSPGL